MTQIPPKTIQRSTLIDSLLGRFRITTRFWWASAAMFILLLITAGLFFLYDLTIGHYQDQEA